MPSIFSSVDVWRYTLLTFSYHETFRYVVAGRLSVFVDFHEVLLLFWVLKHHIWVVDLLPDIFFFIALVATLSVLDCLCMRFLNTTPVILLLPDRSLLGSWLTWVLALWVWLAFDYILEQSEFLFGGHWVMTFVHSHVENTLVRRVLSCEKVVWLRVQISLIPHSSLDVAWRNSARFYGRVWNLACLCTSDL